jgi:hypothetical protein
LKISSLSCLFMRTSILAFGSIPMTVCRLSVRFSVIGHVHVRD